MNLAADVKRILPNGQQGGASVPLLSVREALYWSVIAEAVVASAGDMWFNLVNTTSGGASIAANFSDGKAAALRQYGAVNPRPETVTDDAFRADDFFDPRDLVQVKYEMVRRVQTEGQSVTQTAAAFGFSRPSFYQAQRALAEAGLAGLLPQRRGPHGPHKLQGDVLAFLEQARAEQPRPRARQLAERIQQRFGVSLHPRTIERVLAGQKKPAEDLP